MGSQELSIRHTSHRDGNSRGETRAWLFQSQVLPLPSDRETPMGLSLHVCPTAFMHLGSSGGVCQQVIS